MTTPAIDWLKDPDAVLDWPFDWSQWLADGENITTSVMTVSAGLVLNSSGFSATSTVAWLSGGTPGIPYTLANRVTTSQGRTDERTITIRVQNR
jgi:hypothetical protein